METVYESTPGFGKRFRGQCRARAAWAILRLVFLRKLDVGVRAIPLMSVLAKWYTDVVVGLLQGRTRTSGIEGLHIGAERSVNCAHMQALITNILKRRPEVLQVPDNVRGQSGRADCF